MKICVVCRNETNKYKCPNCSEPYCSLDCYKTHKITPCKIKENKELFVEDKIPQRTVMFVTEDTVDPQKLNELDLCEPLKSLLYNPHLRKLLTEIDQSSDAWKAMRVAMLEPLFLEFADECLKVVEPVFHTGDEFI